MSYYKRKIIFFYPSRVVGGAEMQIVRMAQSLSNLGETVVVIDYEGGTLYSELYDTKVTMISYLSSQILCLNKSDCLILTAMLPCPIDNIKIHPESIILFYCMHFFSFLWLLPQLKLPAGNIDISLWRNLMEKQIPKQYTFLKNKLSKISKKNGLIFIDSNNIDFNNQLFDLNISETVFKDITCSIPCAETKLPLLLNIDKMVDPSIINIGWLGRFSIDKYQCILFLIRALNLYLIDKPVKACLHLIGDGEMKEIILSEPSSEKLEVIHIGILKNQELDFYMKHKIDILFAMGTSLLEAAKLKIPTAIVDSSITPISMDYKMAWLFEANALGEYAGLGGNKRKHLFSDMIKQVYSDQLKQEYGEKSFQYFRERHSLEITIEQLLFQINNCSFLGDDYEKHSYFPVLNM